MVIQTTDNKPVAINGEHAPIPLRSFQSSGYKSGATDNRECFLSLEANGNINSEGRLFAYKEGHGHLREGPR